MASSSTTLRRNFCSIGCKALPSGSLYFRQPRYGTSRPAQERLNIYAAARVARHFLGCCIKPVTGLIVSRGMLLLWTHPISPLRSGQKGSLIGAHTQRQRATSFAARRLAGGCILRASARNRQ